MFLAALGIPTAAQDRTALTIEENLSAAIPIAEADQHLIHRQVPAYPPLARAARLKVLCD
jgi:hypothetical protein